MSDMSVMSIRTVSVASRPEPIFINRVNERFEAHRHTHDFIEITFVAAGSGVHYMNQHALPVRRGDLYIINYGVSHEFRPAPGGQLIVYNCIFYPEFLDYRLVGSRDFSDVVNSFLFRSLSPLYTPDRPDIHASGAGLTLLEGLYERMYEEYSAKENGYLEMLRALVMELIVTVFRLYRNQSASGAMPHRRLIENVVAYMRDHYAQTVRLEDLSMMAFLSRNHFCRCFKELTGMTAVEYMQKLRVEEAARLLKNTLLDVGQVGERVGYADRRYFNDVFKRIMGMTPGQYRIRG